MYLEEHYQSYRAAVQRDALPNFAEYAGRTPTADPTNYPTVLDYLKSTTSCLNMTVANRDHNEYFKYLAYHQEACLMLFKRMFNEELDKSKDYTVAVLDLVHRYGWRSFKYADTVITFDRFHIIPRYSAKMQEYVEGDLPCLSGDEMDAVMDPGAAPDDGERALQLKEGSRVFLVRLPRDNSLLGLPFEIRNSGTVADWTGRLQ